MIEHNTTLATNYYRAVNDKNFAEIEKFLHPNIQLIGPMGEITGKENVFGAVKRFLNAFNTLTIRTVFSSQDQALLIYELDCPEPIGYFRGAAALMTLKDGLIVRLELFFDPRPFLQ